MSDILTTLHPENDESVNLYPNVKKDNIPNKSIDRNKLGDDVNSLLDSINELHPSGVDTSAHILAFTTNKGIYIGSDTGNWYYWNGTAYVSGGTYQATVIADGSITPAKLDRAYVELNAFNEGYGGFYAKDGIWERQGLDNYGNVQNLANVATLFKSEPHNFETSWTLKNLNNGYRFNICKYTKNDDVYTFEQGWALIDSGELSFESGYYKIGFVDSTGSSPNYYNMDITTRTNTINSLFNIYYCNIIKNIDNRVKVLEDNTFKIKKPFVMFSFDWYSHTYTDARYQVLGVEYGYHATFCLDPQTSDYNINQNLTRAQFDEMLANGWDWAPYAGIGERGETKDSWKAYIQGILTQKENMMIFNPVMYNTPDNNRASYISDACKELGFICQRASNPSTNNFIKTPNQFNLGATYLTNDSLQSCKDKLDEAIANGWGVCFYTHNISDTSSTSETTFRNFVTYIHQKVLNGELEVLSARDFANKYHTDKSILNDYEARIKLGAFLHNLVTE